MALGCRHVYFNMTARRGETQMGYDFLMFLMAKDDISLVDKLLHLCCNEIVLHVLSMKIRKFLAND